MFNKVGNVQERAMFMSMNYLESMKILVYEMSGLRIVRSMKCPVYEMSSL